MNKEDVRNARTCTHTHTHTHTNTLEYYSAIKKNEILPYATTWMDLEDIMLSEIRQRKTNIIQSHLYVESGRKNKTTKLINTENRLMVATGGRNG